MSAQADARGITDTTKVIGAVDLLAVRDGGDDEDRRSVARAESRTRELFPSEDWPPRDDNSINNNGRGRGWVGVGATAPTAPTAPTTVAPPAGPTRSPTAARRRCSLGRRCAGFEMFRRRAAGPDGRSSLSSSSGVGVLRRVSDAARVELLGQQRVVESMRYLTSPAAL